MLLSGQDLNSSLSNTRAPLSSLTREHGCQERKAAGLYGGVKSLKVNVSPTVWGGPARGGSWGITARAHPKGRSLRLKYLENSDRVTPAMLKREKSQTKRNLGDQCFWKKHTEHSKLRMSFLLEGKGPVPFWASVVYFWNMYCLRVVPKGRHYNDCCQIFCYYWEEKTSRRKW